MTDCMVWHNRMLSVRRLDWWLTISLAVRKRVKFWPVCSVVLKLITVCKLYTDNYLYLRIVSYRSPLVAAVLAFMWPYPELSPIITTQAERDRLNGKWWR